MKSLYVAAALVCSTAFFSSCDGDGELVPVSAATIEFDNPVVDIFKSIAAYDGSEINVIDSYLCFDIAYPVTVVANGTQLTLNSAADLPQVEAVFAQSSSDTDTLEYAYPLNVINSTYQTVSLASKEELDALALECTDAGVSCLGITYPLSIVPTGADDYAVAFDNDQQLYEYFAALTEGSFAINYPVTLTGYDGQQVTATSNELLFQTIQEMRTACTANTCLPYSTSFGEAYSGLKAFTTTSEDFTMDTFTHEYNFTTIQGGTICSIGYKAEYNTTPIEYRIEITDAEGATVYNGTHTFSPYYKEFVSIPEVTLNAGETYTIKRSISSYAVGMGIGTLLYGSDTANPLLPATGGNITINSARFYGGGGSEDAVYDRLPDIDFVYKATAE